MYIAVLALVACGSEQERLAERALRTGAGPYHARLFAAADSAYAEAPDDERAIFNRGNSNHRLGNWTEAIAYFKAAAGMDSTQGERARVHFNLGNSYLGEAMHADTLAKRQNEQLATMQVDGPDIATKVAQYVLRDSVQRDIKRLETLVDSSLLAALEGYKESLRNAPGDNDARYNLVYVQRLIEQRPKDGDADGNGGDKDKDKELSARAKLIMERADELVEKYKFREALDVLQQGLKQDPSLKAKKEYMDKLDVVTKAASAT
jgi:tetratricopeptide (TPR) repeat protein